MRKLRFTFIFASFLLVASCASTENFTRLYENASVELQSEEWRGFTVVEGENIVLEKSYSQSSLPFVVDGISGYRLHLEVSREALYRGNSFEIPSENIEAYLHTLYAPSYKNISNVRGKIRVNELTSNGVDLEIDVNSPGSNWSYTGIDFFRYAKLSCIGRVDWACEFYSK